jgi:VIT1/CCC1 family predicted Fe2+/Mn2+ transporter
LYNNLEGDTEMGLEEIKSTIKGLTVQERRKIALYILELEKEHVSKTIGPQLAEDLDDVSKVVQEAVEKLKKFVNKN